MADLKLNTANGSITLKPENGNGNIDISIPRKGFASKPFLKHYTSTYTAGAWQTGTGFSTLPGSNYNFLPTSSTSKIKYSFNFAYGWEYNSHSIQHMIFYGGGSEKCRWTIASTHNEGRDTFEWIIDSPGAGVGCNFYISTREYSSNGHQVSFHRTHYWNGTSGVQNCYAQLEITEFEDD